MKQRNPNYEPFRKKGYDAKNELKELKSESWEDWDKRMEEFVKDFEE